MLSVLLRFVRWPALLLVCVWCAAGVAWAQRVGSVNFTAPPGWTVKTEAQLATLTAPGGAAQGLMLVIPDQPVNGEAATWLGTVVRQLSGDGQVTDESEIQRLGENRLIKGVEVRTGGRSQFRLYLAVLEGAVSQGQRATLYVLVAPDAAAIGRFQSAFTGLVNSGSGASRQAQSQGQGAPTPGSGSLTGPRTALPDVKPMNAAQFLASGGDPESSVIPDEFRCYQEKKGDSLTPELRVQILPGGKYRTPFGTGSFTIKKDGSLVKTAWRGGPLDGASGYLSLTNHGQNFDLSDVGEDVLERSLSFECYQRGPMEQLRLLQFKRRTPAPASYPCVSTDGSNRRGGTLEILPGGAYRLGGQGGRFSTDFRSDQDDDWSDLTFSGGPLDDQDASYQEDDQGLRQLRLNRPKLECRLVVKPTALPRYGAAKAPAPPKGSGGLSGAYAGWWLNPVALMYGGCYVCWEVYVFAPNGYVLTEEPEESLSEADCSRTHPNGLPICEVYRVQGGQIVIGKAKPESFKKSGADLIIGGDTFQPLRKLEGVALRGTFEAQTVVGGSMSTVSGSYQDALTFAPQGRFTRARSGGIVATATTTGTPQGDLLGGVYASSESQNSGTYVFKDYTLTLTYGDGRVERRFAYALPGKDGKLDAELLRIGGESYTLKGSK